MSKFDSLRDQVVYRATLEGTCETIGSVEYGTAYTLLEDYYGLDYIVTEDSQGFVSVESFDHIAINDRGYHCPTADKWAECRDDVALNQDGVSEVYVCDDCYSVYHFGTISEESMVFGLYDTETRTQSIDLAIARNSECTDAINALSDDGYQVFDWTDSNTGRGIIDFTWWHCQACNSALGGTRHRLQVCPR